MRIGTRQILLAILIIAFVAGAQACTGSSSSQSIPQTTADVSSNSQFFEVSSFADFSSLDVVTGQEITLSSFEGSAVLLNFVNYGCDPALNEVVSEQLIAIRELQDQRGDFVPVSVFCGCCPEDVLRDFAEQNSFIWPWILDSDYSIVNDYASYIRAYGYPTLIFIDQEQYISEVAGSTSIADLSAKLDQITGINN